MKALMKTAPGVGNVEVREIAEPATTPGHVKIAVSATGICGTDLHIYHDEYRSWPPVVLGHEVAGRVVEVGAPAQASADHGRPAPGQVVGGTGIAGAQVSTAGASGERVSVGDRVTTETYFSTCGICRFCRAGRINLCPERRSIGSAVDGGFARYVVVPQRNVHRLPEGVSDLAGALSEPLACVVHGALELLRVTPEDVAVVAGPGAIGLLTLQAVKAAGARVYVLGTSADAHRLRTALELGADGAFDVQSDPYREALLDLTGGLGADIVYECSGAGPAAQMLLDLVRRGGQYAQIGLFGKPIAWDLEAVCYKELSVTGSNASVPSAWARALALMAAGKVRTEPLISSVRPLTEWRDAFDAFERRSGLKTLLQPVE